jgi:hypothetical protein
MTDTADVSRQYGAVEIEKANPHDYTERDAALEFLSYKQALAEVEKFLSDAGVDNMKVSEMTLSYFMPSSLLLDTLEGENGEKGDSMAVINDIRNGKYDGQIADVQIDVKLSRYYNGVPVTTWSASGPTAMEQGAVRDTNMYDYFRQNWPYETFSISVCKEGISNIEWSAPYEIIETVVEDSDMILFNDAVDIFERMYNIKYSGLNFEIVESAKRLHNQELSITNDGEIYNVTLSLRRVSEQNSKGRGLLVPVWDFYGIVTSTTWENGAVRNKYYTPREPSESFFMSNEPLLTINAIDGTVIDLAKGY